MSSYIYIKQGVAIFSCSYKKSTAWGLYSSSLYLCLYGREYLVYTKWRINSSRSPGSKSITGISIKV